jgi:glycosyltransferase involved in cell wall biosynthesis
MADSPLLRSRYRVVAASVSEEAKVLLRSGGLDVEVVDDISTERFGDILERVSVYVGLSVDEGFGLPFAEAAYCGADVVAVDLPVAREALGPDGNFLPDREVTVRDLEAAMESWDLDRVCRLRDRARQRSWRDCADSIAEWVAAV